MGKSTVDCLKGRLSARSPAIIYGFDRFALNS
jgi:hypothetical protein